MANLTIFPHANCIRDDAKKQREKNVPPITIYNRARKTRCFRFYGDYIVARMVIEGCLEVGKVKAVEFWDFVLPLKKTEDESYECILEDFAIPCGVKKENLKAKLEDWIEAHPHPKWSERFGFA